MLDFGHFGELGGERMRELEAPRERKIGAALKREKESPLASFLCIECSLSTSCAHVGKLGLLTLMLGLLIIHFDFTFLIWGSL